MAYWKELCSLQQTGVCHLNKFMPKLVNRLECNSEQCLQLRDHVNDPTAASPPVASHVNVVGQLAISNDMGTVFILHDRHGKTEQLASFFAHDNAIFDLAWNPLNNTELLTGSGDTTCALWDAAHQQHKDSFRGHKGSVKTLTFNKCDAHVFASGSRDGSIKVWDIRCSNSALRTIANAHPQVSTSVTPRRKRARVSEITPVTPNGASVLSVSFVDQYHIISSGAKDPFLKVWDLRKDYEMFTSDPKPCHRLILPSINADLLDDYTKSTQRCSHLVVNSSGTVAYANTSDGVIFSFDLVSTDESPLCAYFGHKVLSLYVKLSLSEDLGLLGTGSSDGSVYIWNLKSKKTLDRGWPLVRLNGHEAEVSSVAWSPISQGVALWSVADDGNVMRWGPGFEHDPDDGSVVRKSKPPVGTCEVAPHRGVPKFEAIHRSFNASQPSYRATPKTPQMRCLSRASSANSSMSPLMVNLKQWLQSPSAGPSSLNSPRSSPGMGLCLRTGSSSSLGLFSSPKENRTPSPAARSVSTTPTSSSSLGRGRNGNRRNSRAKRPLLQTAAQKTITTYFGT